jgi:hypothetical protein
MGNWKLLEPEKYKLIWDFIYDVLLFTPNKDNNALIKLPYPNRYYDISKFYNEGFSDEYYDDLHVKTLKIFSREKVIYALNWQHDCYSFNPNKPFELNEFNEWLIPVFPNGDYLFFLTENLDNGIFADGINKSVSIYGKYFLDAFELVSPKIFLV